MTRDEGEKAAEKWLELTEASEKHPEYGVFLIGTDPDETAPDRDNFVGIGFSKTPDDCNRLAWSMRSILGDIIAFETKPLSAQLEAADALADAIRPTPSTPSHVLDALRAYRAARKR